MNRKRMLQIFVIFVSISILVACSNNANSSDSSNNKPNSTEETVTLTFWHHYSSASPEEKTLTEKLIPEFEKQNPKIKVNAVAFPWDELHKKIQIGGSGGDLPDIARLDIIWVPEFEKQGLLQPMDEKFADFDEITAGLLSGPVSTGVVNGHHYGLPLNTNTKIMFWNQEMFTTSGVEKAPVTTDEFFAALEKIQGSFKDSWAFGEPALQGWNILPWIWSNGGDVLSPDNTTAEGYFNSPNTVDIISKLKEAYVAGSISGFKPGGVPVTEGHAKNSYAMMAEGPWAFAQFDSQFPDFKAMTAPFPAGSAGSIQVLGGEDLGIFSKDHAEQSWEFVKFMVSEAAQVEMGKVGQIPVNLDAINHSEITAIEYFTPFLAQLKTSKARPTVATWPQIDVVISESMEKIFLTDADIKSELDSAVERIDDLLK